MQSTPELPSDIWHLLVPMMANRWHVRFGLCYRAARQTIAPFVTHLRLTTYDGHNTSGMWGRELLRYHDDLHVNLNAPLDDIHKPSFDTAVHFKTFSNVRFLSLQLPYEDNRPLADASLWSLHWKMLMLLASLAELKELWCELDWIVCPQRDERIVFSRLTNLVVFNCDSIGEGHLPSMPHLATVRLGNSQHTNGWLWDQLALLPSLTSLRGCAYVYDGPHSDKVLTKLRHLELRNPLLSPWLVDTISTYATKLESLSLEISTEDLLLQTRANLARLTALRELDAMRCMPDELYDYNNGRDDDDHSRLLTNLTKFAMTTPTPFYSKLALRQAMACADTLVHLSLHGRPSFDLTINLAAAARTDQPRICFRQLKSLELKHARVVFPATPFDVGDFFPRLEALCYENDDDGLLVGVAASSTLLKLSVGFLTAYHMWRILRKLRLPAQLTDLNIAPPKVFDGDYRLVWSDFLLSRQYDSLRRVRVQMPFIQCAVVSAFLLAAPNLYELRVIAEVDDWADRGLAVLGSVCRHETLNFLALIPGARLADYHGGDCVANYPRTFLISQFMSPFMARMWRNEVPKYSFKEKSSLRLIIGQFPYFANKEDLKAFVRRRCDEIVFASVKSPAVVTADVCLFLTRERLETFWRHEAARAAAQKKELSGL